MNLATYIHRRESRIFLAGWWGGFGFAFLIFIPPVMLYFGK